MTTYNYGDKVIFTEGGKKFEAVVVEGRHPADLFAAEIFFGDLEEYEVLCVNDDATALMFNTAYAHENELTKIGDSA